MLNTHIRVLCMVVWFDCYFRVDFPKATDENITLAYIDVK